jgi:chloride channel 3/4/5
MEIFKKVGPRVVLVEHRGKLSGVVTRKDVLKFQFMVENREHPKDDVGEALREERLWALIVSVCLWVRRKVLRREEEEEGEEADLVPDVELDERRR